MKFNHLINKKIIFITTLFLLISIDAMAMKRRGDELGRECHKNDVTTLVANSAPEKLAFFDDMPDEIIGEILRQTSATVLAFYSPNVSKKFRALSNILLSRAFISLALVVGDDDSSKLSINVSLPNSSDDDASPSNVDQGTVLIPHAFSADTDEIYYQIAGRLLQHGSIVVLDGLSPNRIALISQKITTSPTVVSLTIQAADDASEIKPYNPVNTSFLTKFEALQELYVSTDYSVIFSAEMFFPSTLSDCHFSDAREFRNNNVQYLSANTSILSLQLANIDNNGLKDLCTRCPNLTDVNLDGCHNLTPEGFNNIVLLELVTLSLNNTDMSDFSFDEAARNRFPKLKNLTLGGSPDYYPGPEIIDSIKKMGIDVNVIRKAKKNLINFY